jgi:hypothetical protein
LLFGPVDLATIRKKNLPHEVSKNLWEVEEMWSYFMPIDFGRGQSEKAFSKYGKTA